MAHSRSRLILLVLSCASLALAGCVDRDAESYETPGAPGSGTFRGVTATLLLDRSGDTYTGSAVFEGSGGEIHTTLITGTASDDGATLEVSESICRVARDTCVAAWPGFDLEGSIIDQTMILVPSADGAPISSLELIRDQGLHKPNDGFRPQGGWPPDASNREDLVWFDGMWDGPVFGLGEFLEADDPLAGVTCLTRWGGQAEPQGPTPGDLECFPNGAPMTLASELPELVLEPVGGSFATSLDTGELSAEWSAEAWSLRLRGAVASTLVDREVRPDTDAPVHRLYQWRGIVSIERGDGAWEDVGGFSMTSWGDKVDDPALTP